MLKHSRSSNELPEGEWASTIVNLCHNQCGQIRRFIGHWAMYLANSALLKNILTSTFILTFAVWLYFERFCDYIVNVPINKEQLACIKHTIVTVLLLWIKALPHEENNLGVFYLTCQISDYSSRCEIKNPGMLAINYLFSLFFCLFSSFSRYNFNT